MRPPGPQAVVARPGAGFAVPAQGVARPGIPFPQQPRPAIPFPQIRPPMQGSLPMVRGGIKGTEEAKGTFYQKVCQCLAGKPFFQLRSDRTACTFPRKLQGAARPLPVPRPSVFPLPPQVPLPQPRMPSITGLPAAGPAPRPVAGPLLMAQQPEVQPPQLGMLVSSGASPGVAADVAPVAEPAGSADGQTAASSAAPRPGALAGTPTAATRLS